MDRKYILIAIILFAVIGIVYGVVYYGNKPFSPSSNNKTNNGKIKPSMTPTPNILKAIYISLIKKDNGYKVEKYEKINGKAELCEKDLKSDFIYIEGYDVNNRLLFSCMKSTLETIFVDVPKGVEADSLIVNDADNIGFVANFSQNLQKIIIKDNDKNVLDTKDISL